MLLRLRSCERISSTDSGFGSGDCMYLVVSGKI